MIDKKNTFSYNLVDSAQFLLGTNFVCGAFDNCPVYHEICIFATNHPYLLRIGDDRKFV